MYAHDLLGNKLAHHWEKYQKESRNKILLEWAFSTWFCRLWRYLRVQIEIGGDRGGSETKGHEGIREIGLFTASLTFGSKPERVYLKIRCYLVSVILTVYAFIDKILFLSLLADKFPQLQIDNRLTKFEGDTQDYTCRFSTFKGNIFKLYLFNKHLNII